ncbi:DoxX family protein [Litoribacter ruber]|uniref:DoxX family protein n=1 Tax=Litoribacter ruber TaxID=702568 RepID=A0AAP2G3J7_9BACT|nr:MULTISPECIES: DoxX family protein [Litoribacter]MBS9523520.1 DoxX family protein [Litoribacter alkaliphilus]MBT0812063.1 DoxX family protein [Litoribacter ruber]
MKQLIFSTRPFFTDVGLLIFRVGVSLMMMTHGWAKILNFSERLGSFPDPLGIGSAFSLQLVIFAEFFCAILVALGFATRLALIPLIINMFVISFVVHAGEGFSDKELPLLFLLSWIFLFLRGAGIYSMDGQMMKRKKY